MNRLVRLAFAGFGAMTACIPVAHAAVIYDTSLAAPGVYFGTGNSGQNFGWTVNTFDSIELALTTVQRKVGGLTPTTSNIYNVQLGADPTQSTRAWWNFNFSINLQAAGDTGLHLSDVTGNVTVLNMLNNQSISGDPLALFPDSDGYSSAGKDAGHASVNKGADYAYQNSENLTFGQFAPLAFDMNQNDTYMVTLSLLNLAGQTLGSVNEYIVAGTGGGVTIPVAVPQPGTLPLFASGLVALGLLGWRRKKKPATV